MEKSSNEWNIKCFVVKDRKGKVVLAEWAKGGIGSPVQLYHPLNIHIFWVLYLCHNVS